MMLTLEQIANIGIAFLLFYPLFLHIKDTVARWRKESLDNQRRQWEIDFENAEHPVNSERKAYGHLEDE